jgi:L-fuculose-phosphate aldolase
MSAMLLQREREAIARHAHKLRPDRLVVGVSGNISARSGEHVAITPSGLDYDDVTPERVCVLALGGEAVEAELEPSTEVPMHLGIYRRTGAGAIVHTHSPFATVLGTVVDELPPVHYLLAQLGGPVRTSSYATPGSEELADNAARGLEGRSATLLANHGAITIGATVEEAYNRSLILESICELYYRARLLGEPRLLEAGEIDHVADELSDYGQVVAREGATPP